MWKTIQSHSLFLFSPENSKIEDNVIPQHNNYYIRDILDFVYVSQVLFEDQ